MTKQEFQELVHSGPVLLDGAVGSVLLERGMAPGDAAELWADATGGGAGAAARLRGRRGAGSSMRPRFKPSLRP